MSKYQVNEATKMMVDEYGDQWEEEEEIPIVGQQEEVSNPTSSSFLLFRFPRQELWIPKSQSLKLGAFPDAGFSWSVFSIPEWLYEEEATDDRNVYEQRIDNNEPLSKSTIPIESLEDPWVAADRSLWLRGQIRQIVSQYDRSWAMEHGMVMSEGVRSRVNPTGERGVAEVTVHVPVEGKAEEVFDYVQRALDDDIGDVLQSSVRETPGGVDWSARVYAPYLVR